MRGPGAGATVFQSALALAGTWDPLLVERIGSVIGQGLVSLGIRRTFSPLCDVAKDPRWGRIEETYGEDSYLVGQMAAA